VDFQHHPVLTIEGPKKAKKKRQRMRGSTHLTPDHDKKTTNVKKEKREGEKGEQEDVTERGGYGDGKKRQNQ